MDRTRMIVTTIVGLVGVVWLLQGVGVLPGSFMSGDTFWAIAGGLLILGSVAAASWHRLRRP